MAPDGSSDVTTTNNVFDGTGRGYEWKIQFGSAANPVFRHNTVINASAAFDSKTGHAGDEQRADQGQRLGQGLRPDQDQRRQRLLELRVVPQPVRECRQRARHQQRHRHPRASAAAATPTSYIGWRLATTSPGNNAASDGTDIGIP